MLPPFGFVAYLLFKDQSTALLAWATTREACAEAAVSAATHMLEEAPPADLICIEPTGRVSVVDTPTGFQVSVRTP